MAGPDVFMVTNLLVVGLSMAKKLQMSLTSGLLFAFVAFESKMTLEICPSLISLIQDGSFVLLCARKRIIHQANSGILTPYF